MPRNKCYRHISGNPKVGYYKPAGIPLRDLDEVLLSIDEFEAIRLADFEKQYQENAAEKMQISRQTFGRILAEAHHKIADAFIHGKSIKLENQHI